MAKSKYEYVKAFERADALLPNTYIVVRIDGRGFHGLTDRYDFQRPNDPRALNLMNVAAAAVVKETSDIVIAYGVSDEYSFVFDKACQLFSRRESKIVSMAVSTFTAHYIHRWPDFFPDAPLTPPLPTFDGRVILYPDATSLRDYMSWRQVDCHINNLYNTTFWALVQQGGRSRQDAENLLQGTVSANKHEILFSQFGINYDKEPPMFRKGSVVYREYEQEPVPASTDSAEQASPKDPEPEQEYQLGEQPGRKKRSKAKPSIVTAHVDIIKDEFWDYRPWLVAGKSR